jgi:putative cardiolipin synthase
VPPAPGRRLRRVATWLVVGVLCAVVAFYVAFAALLGASEREWLGKAPVHDAIDVRSHEPHELALLDEGGDSLATRIRLLEGATRSIDLEFFIYELDATSRLVSQIVARKAAAGVRVRLLVDFAAPVFKLRPAFAAALARAGVEVRYYNTASWLRFFAVQHRTHRKLLAVDGETAIVGGRNIADDYFDNGASYNFLDSDLLVRGPVVAAMVESFELYWNSPWAAPPGPVAAGEAALSRDFLKPREQERRLDALVRGAPPRHFTTTCDDVHLVTDYPGAGVERRRVYAALARLAGEAKSEILLESPYFVLRPDGAGLIEETLARGVRLQVLTNSLRSTDAYYTVAALLPAVGALERPGFSLWAYRGDPLAGAAVVPPGSPLWGVHAKRGVFDGQTTVVGTYNVDPRSANLNAEMIVVCRGNAALAAAVKASIERRIAQSTLIVGGPGAAGIRGLLRGATPASLAKMTASLPLVRYFDFLL